MKSILGPRAPVIVTDQLRRQIEELSTRLRQVAYPVILDEIDPVDLAWIYSTTTVDVWARLAEARALIGLLPGPGTPS